METKNSLEKSQPSTTRASLVKPLVLGLGLVLLCYFLVAYVILPIGWNFYTQKHPSFDDDPRLTKTGEGHPGGPLNVALIGSENQLRGIMEEAKWYDSNPLGVKSDLKIAVETVLSRSYDEAPVSKLYLFGRKEDLAFEQTVDDNPRQRHHVRFWRTKRVSSDNHPIWIGAAYHLMSGYIST